MIQQLQATAMIHGGDSLHSRWIGNEKGIAPAVALSRVGFFLEPTPGKAKP